jgi:hypothetical protein
MSLFPGIGEGYDILTLLNGTDPMTKEQLTPFTRNITIVGLVSGVGSGSAARRAVTEGLERLTEELGTHGDDLIPNAQEVLGKYKMSSIADIAELKGKVSVEKFIAEVREDAGKRILDTKWGLSKQILGRAADSTVLGKNLEAVGKVRPENSAAHHIVAGGAPNADAEETRELLRKAGIDINEASNGVFLPRKVNM